MFRNIGTDLGWILQKVKKSPSSSIDPSVSPSGISWNTRIKYDYFFSIFPISAGKRTLLMLWRKATITARAGKSNPKNVIFFLDTWLMVWDCLLLHFYLTSRHEPSLRLEHLKSGSMRSRFLLGGFNKIHFFFRPRTPWFWQESLYWMLSVGSWPWLDCWKVNWNSSLERFSIRFVWSMFGFNFQDVVLISLLLPIQQKLLIQTI